MNPRITQAHAAVQTALALAGRVVDAPGDQGQPATNLRGLLTTLLALLDQTAKADVDARLRVIRTRVEWQ